MKRVIYSVILVVFIFAVGCIPECSNQVTIDFTFDQKSQHILIPVTIGDSILKFHFDTGAEVSIILSPKDLGLKTNHSDSVKLMYELVNLKSMAARTFPEKVSIGDVRVSRKVKFCEQVAGLEENVLGSDIIHLLFWRFNFDSMKVTVSDGPIKIEGLSEWVKIPYKLRSNNMYVHVKINDTIDMGNYAFDTGYHLKSGDEYPIILYHMITSQDKSMKIGPKIMTTGFKELRKFNNGLQNNYGGFSYVYDSITLFGHKSRNCIVTMVRHDLPTGFGFGDYLLTLGYATQFHEMYLDTRKKIIYLKP